MQRLAACSFRWIIAAESTVRWFIVREKYYWMAADLAEHGVGYAQPVLLRNPN
jgi:hypothetical protein